MGFATVGFMCLQVSAQEGGQGGCRCCSCCRCGKRCCGHGICPSHAQVTCGQQGGARQCRPRAIGRGGLVAVVTLELDACDNAMQSTTQSQGSTDWG
jgi:hypothetical protein